MYKLPNKTNKFLNDIYKQKRFNIEVPMFEHISILSDQNYIKVHKDFPRIDSSLIYPWEHYIHITNEGKLYLSTLKFENRKFYIPIIVSSCLSIIAIIISIVALLRP